MSARRPRFIGVAVAGVAFAAFFLWWRTASGPERPAQEAGPARRGGQVVFSVRAEPRSFNRLVASDQPSDDVAMLTQGRLVRINRSTFELEPWLAERWESSADGRTHTLHLRQGVAWSDGTPFTSADVVFSVQALFDPNVKSVLASSLEVGGQPLRATAPDPATVVVTYAAPSGPGLRLLDMLPLLPKHKLEGALAAGTLASAWNTSTPPSEIVGLGPFVIREHVTGQRLVLERNPRYWRKAPDGGALPYLDRLVLELVPEQNAQILRLQSGAVDVINSELRPDDYVPVRRSEEEGRLRMVETGISPDADGFWFCLKPEDKARDPRWAFMQKREFRQAISHAVDREEFAQDVYLGEATPVWGPITPGNRLWFSPNVPRYPYSVDRAKELLASIGLTDRNGNGTVEDASGAEARFTVMTQAGVSWYERGTRRLRDELAKVGIGLDIAPLEFSTMIKRMLSCDYDAIYYRPINTDLDPAGNLDYWMSSGHAHLWNLAQGMPATEWEKRIDTLMLEQAAALDPARRKALFDDVQRIFAENLPVLYFAAPRHYVAYSTRVGGVVPSVMRPPILWNADLLSVEE